MRAIADIDYLGDEDLRSSLVRWSATVLAVGAVAGVALGLGGVFGVGAETERLGGGVLGVAAWLGVLLAVVCISLPVHELVHAALFVLLGGPGVRVRFGHEAGMLYAGCPGLVLARTRFCVVLAGPAVVLSAALVAGGCVLGFPLLGFAAFVVHLSGCVGDLLAIVRALSTPGCTHLEDTDCGVRLLGE